MITDSYDIETEPMINLFDFYSRRGDFADICLIIFLEGDFYQLRVLGEALVSQCLQEFFL